MRIGFEDANTINRHAFVLELIVLVFVAIYTIHMILCPKGFVFSYNEADGIYYVETENLRLDDRR